MLERSFSPHRCANGTFTSPDDWELETTQNSEELSLRAEVDAWVRQGTKTVEF